MASMTKPRVYGAWAGNPKGNPEDPSFCIESVIGNERGAIHRQCGRKRGFGPDGLYCKQHDPGSVKARDDARHAAYEAESAARAKRWNAEVKRREIVDLAKALVRSKTIENIDALAKAVEELEKIEGS